MPVSFFPPLELLHAQVHGAVLGRADSDSKKKGPFFDTFCKTFKHSYVEANALKRGNLMWMW